MTDRRRLFLPAVVVRREFVFRGGPLASAKCDEDEQN